MFIIILYYDLQNYLNKQEISEMWFEKSYQFN